MTNFLLTHVDANVIADAVRGVGEEAKESTSSAGLGSLWVLPLDHMANCDGRTVKPADPNALSRRWLARR